MLGSSAGAACYLPHDSSRGTALCNAWVTEWPWHAHNVHERSARASHFIGEGTEVTLTLGGLYNILDFLDEAFDLLAGALKFLLVPLQVLPELRAVRQALGELERLQAHAHRHPLCRRSRSQHQTRTLSPSALQRHHRETPVLQLHYDSTHGRTWWTIRSGFTLLTNTSLFNKLNKNYESCRSDETIAA